MSATKSTIIGRAAVMAGVAALAITSFAPTSASARPSEKRTTISKADTTDFSARRRHYRGGNGGAAAAAAFAGIVGTIGAIAASQSYNDGYYYGPGPGYGYGYGNPYNAYGYAGGYDAPYGGYPRGGRYLDPGGNLVPRRY